MKTAAAVTEALTQRMGAVQNKFEADYDYSYLQSSQGSHNRHSDCIDGGNPSSSHDTVNLYVEWQPNRFLWTYSI